jgi:hypothetical protein
MKHVKKFFLLLYGDSLPFFSSCSDTPSVTVVNLKSMTWAQLVLEFLDGKFIEK